MRIAVAAADVFEDVEFSYPYCRLREAVDNVDGVGYSGGTTLETAADPA